MDRNVLQNTENVFEKEYIIEESQTDIAGKASPGALAGIMQDITVSHMNSHGITVESMREKKLIWVIVCTQINISRLPEAGERVEQYTWPGAEKFGMQSRRYVFFTKDGEELLNAASLFLLVDSASRSLSESAKETVSLPVVVMEGEPKLPKMMQKFPALLFGKSHEAAGSEIDYNGHVNNAVYLDWADSIFDSAFLKTRRLKAFWVQYDKEILEGQKVQMSYTADAGSVWLKGAVGGTECFKVKFDF